MKYKKIMLIMLLLLAVLTIGAVSASDDADFNETLTVNNAEDVSVDASLDETDVSEGSEVIAASESDVNSISGEEDVNPILEENSTKMNPGMKVNVEDTEYGEPVEVEITFDNLENGEVTADVANLNYRIKIVNGSAIFNISDLNIGDYDLTVSYAGDETYFVAMVTAQFRILSTGNSTGNSSGIIIGGDENQTNGTGDVSKVDPMLDFEINAVVYPNDLIINIAAPGDATGRVYVRISDKFYTIDIFDGKGCLYVPDLGAGNYTVFADYTGDDKYNNYSYTLGAAVLKADSSISLTDVVFDYGDSGSSTITAVNTVVTRDGITILDAQGNVVANGYSHTLGNVTEGMSDPTVTLKDGVITISGLAAGQYTLKVVSKASENYNAAEANATIIVNKVNLTVSVEDIVFNYGESGTGAIVHDGNGAFGSIVESFDGRVYISGSVVTVSGLNAGNYTLEVNVWGDNNHNSAKATSRVTVNKVDSSLNVLPFGFYYGSSGLINMTFDGASTVVASINGSSDNVEVMDNVIKVSGLNVGSYVMTVTTVPDANHNAVSVNVTVTVNKINSTLTVNDALSLYGQNVVVPVLTDGATGVNATVVECPDAEISYLSDRIVISGLTVGNYTLSVATVPDENHNAARATARITVNRVIVTDANFNEYFNETCELIGYFPELIFTGDFADKQFNINKPVIFMGENAKFTNVQFNIRADNVSIRNMELNYQSAMPIIDVDGVSKFTLENNTIVYSTSTTKDSAISVRNSNEAIIKDNNIKASGSTFVDGILISDSNFTIDSNRITVNSGVDAQGIIIIGSGKGNIKNNDVNVFANRTVYGMNTTTNSTTGDISFQLNITFSFNVIYGEAIIAVGINDDSENIDNNMVTLKAVQATGVIVNSENAKVTNNGIKLISADSDKQDSGLESSATGVKVNVKSTISNNEIDSFDKSISVDGGCATTISNNNLNAPITVSTEGTNIQGNDISTEKDKAIVLLESASNTNVDNNVLTANGAKGNDAVSDEGSGNIISNNKAKPNLEIGSIADIFEGQGVVIIIKADSNFTDTVNVQIGNYNTTAYLINGSAKVNVAADNLSVGDVVVKVTFAGNEKYGDDTVNATFAVNAKIATSIKAAAVTTTYGTSKNIVVTLRDANNKPLSGMRVTVVLNGVKKTLTTNKKGQVSYAIATKLAVKKYTPTITFAGNYKYVKSAASAKVTVNKAKSALTAKKATFKVKKAKKYTIVLKSGKTPIKKVKVTLTVKVKGKTVKITAKTSVKGKATFNLKKLAKKGKYAATVKFAGNKNYNAVTKKVKITVK